MEDSIEGGVLPEAEEGELLPAIRETTAVDRSRISGILRPVAKPEEMLQAQEDTRKMIATILEEGRDYMTIPGTSKPTLVKPGAERVNAAFGCMATYDIIEKEVDHDRLTQWVKRSWEWGERRGEKIWKEEAGESLGLYRYVLLCELVSRASGLVIGSGVGSASTMESKYIDRPRDLENTILKMAKKRAYIDATLSTFGLSEQFTQDTEDMPGEYFEDGKSDGGGWSIDSPAIGKKCKGRSWQEMCEQEAGYVIWAIGGTESFEGMDSLNASQRERLQDELDRLEGIAKAGQRNGNGQSAGASEPSPEEAAAFLKTLLYSSPDTGKHKGENWVRIHKEDPDYFGRVLTQGWGAKFRADEKLEAAIRWAVAGGLDRMKLETTPEPRASEDDRLASTIWLDMVHGQTVTDLDAFAVIHPGVPDDMNEWDESHYQIAVAAFRKAEAKGGAAYILKRAVDALKAREAPSDGDGIPDEMIAQAVRTLQRAERLGLDISGAEAGFEEAVRHADAEVYSLVLQDLRTAFYKKASGRS